MKEHEYQSLYLYMKSVGYPLYPYQKEGITWMVEREIGKSTVRGGLLCDEPGLGKTIQTCACMYKNLVKKTIIILPTAVINQWIDTIKKILPKEQIYLHRGPNRAMTYRELINIDFSILVTSFGTIYDRKKRLSVLHDINWDRIILDEVHYIRNPKSKIAKACLELRGKNKWGLTGTPIQNSLKDLKTLFKFVGLPERFLRTEYLKTVSKHLLKRRTKGEVCKYNEKLNMPKLIQKTYALEFETNEEKEIYNKIKQNAIGKYLETIAGVSLENSNKQLACLELILRLRQASIHPDIAISGLKNKFSIKLSKYNNSSTKINFLVEKVCEKSRNNNCLVFCHFTREIQIIRKQLEINGISALVYDGKMSISQRNKTIKQFAYNKCTDIIFRNISTITKKKLENKIRSFLPKVLLIQINAGGVGLNLQMFNEVFITSPNWNPTNEIQAIARAHRLGQKLPVTVHRLRIYDKEDTIDEMISVTQIKKKELIMEYLNDKNILKIGNIDTSRIKNKDLIEKIH